MIRISFKVESMHGKVRVVMESNFVSEKPNQSKIKMTII